MKTVWKVILTFGVLAFFVFVIALVIGLIASQFIAEDNVSLLGGGTIMVIPIKGEITSGGCPGGLFYVEECATVESVKEQLDEAENDMTVSGVVLDIESGGGSVVASREMMRAVKSFRKPVVARIGEVGASGAYYVASAADKIVADKDSMTGSIGVVMSVMHYYKLMEDWGVNVTVIKSGDSKDIGSPYRPMTEDEKDNLQEMVDTIQEDFIADVALNRNLSVEHVRNISDGSIFLGEKAMELGLVDYIGGYDDAISVAENISGISGKAEIKKPKQDASLWDVIMGG
ncbi:MAG: signal peptide peptidase SppA [Candidatus Altiarchaeota archaeon]|nr:signal peptide peptidase SppA [Candidatus Altiarchaeota archaeon]